MSIMDYTLNKYDMLFHRYLDLLPLNLVYFVLENDNISPPVESMYKMLYIIFLNNILLFYLGF